jgi:hypothetical protein
VESYSLLELDACAVSDKTAAFETAVYREIVQMKQDLIIPIFRCQVIETIVFQYCGHWSLACITRYIWFREPKALESWECRQARSHGKVIIGGHTIQATIGATALTWKWDRTSHRRVSRRTLSDNCPIFFGWFVHHIPFENIKIFSAA